MKAGERENQMMRVVDVRPGPEEIKSAGLAEKNLWIDPGTYRHFVERYREDLVAFERTFFSDDRKEGGAGEPVCPGRMPGAPREAVVEAFERSRPPYHYHRGSIYRYRIDPAGPAERPIILDCYERSEVTGNLLGIPVYSQRQGLLMRFCLWIERRLQEREQRGKG